MDSQEKVVQNSRKSVARLPKLKKNYAKTSYVEVGIEKNTPPGPLADCFPKSSLKARKHVKTILKCKVSSRKCHKTGCVQWIRKKKWSRTRYIA